MASENLALHSVHPYPCKFPPQIVQAHLPKQGVVLDPYCGSGTTLLEAAYRGLDVVGIDCNPIAVLISNSKLVNLDPDLSRQIFDSCRDFDLHFENLQSGDYELHEFEGRDHWFSELVQTEIAYVLALIEDFRERPAARIILSTALSSVTNIFSNQDSETRYVAVEKRFIRGELLKSFLNKSIKIVNAIEERGNLGGNQSVIHGDLRTTEEIDENSVDVIITSPPYANTMDYYLYHKQRMNVLGFDFKATQKAEIGSRYQFSSRKDDVDEWERDYQSGMEHALHALKDDGVAWFVIGDSQIAGNLIDGGQLTVACAKKLGVNAEIVESVPLSGKSRLFSASFQRPNKFEHVVKLWK